MQRSAKQIRDEWKPQDYDRFHITYPISAVLPFVNDKGFKTIREYDGNKVKLFSLRLRTFKLKGIECVSCGTKASFFALERNKGSDTRYHFNLYGFDENGTEVIFTKDHIKPKSKGGKDHISNMQTMCGICNCIKGNKV